MKRAPDWAIQWEAGSSRYDKDISICIYIVDQGGVYMFISLFHVYTHFSILPYMER